MAYWKDRYDELFRDADCGDADYGGGRTGPLPGLGEPAPTRPRVQSQATCGHRRNRAARPRATPGKTLKTDR